MKYYINCYTWNDIIPTQYIWEETCGYYALRNGNLMYKILSNIKSCKSQKEYIKLISTSKYFPKLISSNQSIKDIKWYKSNFIEKKNNLSGNDIINLNNKCNPDTKLDLLYNSNNIKINLEIEEEINYFILYRKAFKVSTHWIPIILHKINNQINFHILDSFNTTWYGDKITSNIIRQIKNRNPSIHFVLKCKDKYTISVLNMIYQKVSSFILLFLIILFLVFVTLRS
ncbi:hypothetical protein CPAV1605_546 [seawater metagenome]|uniref:Uncharacterized protein n=1 Tax=seawater metagenome TaxID=1561972 RepID=A0A5E8CHV5_9ZZZZ